jgi:hypothetical protein
MSNLDKLNKSVNKAQSESEAIKSKGFVNYVKGRKVSMSLAVFLITLVGTFLAGAILF